MKHVKKLASLLLTLVMLLAMSTTAFAQDVSSGGSGNATITITNASKGETYKVYKLFDATVTGTDGGSIAYTGNVPTELSNYFEANSKGNITVKEAAYEDSAAKTGMSEELREALKGWTETTTATATAESDGTVLKFTGLDYGYYVVTTTQGDQAITVTSTNPNAQIVDKNSSVPSDLTKTADSQNVNIGDTVTYTVTFKTANYSGAGSDAKKIISYTIEDTLPDFLSDVTVTSIIVDDDGDATTQDDRINVTAQFENKKITLDWYNNTAKEFLYKNGATVTLVYTATVTDKAAIDGAGNKNTVTVSWTDEDGKTTPDGSKLTTDETIYTYAIALKKVDEKGNALSGATFQLPFYVKETKDPNDGAYIYAGTTAGADLTNSVTTGADGLIIVKGVKAGTYSITETVAPQGYNLLTEAFFMEAVQTGKTTTTTTVCLDADGNVTDSVTNTKVEVTLDKISAAVKVVVNKTGAVLPSTGGMGTTVFYVVGGLLVIAAALLLVMKKRMKRDEQ